jgi:AraC-like DNA-binding protein
VRFGYYDQPHFVREFKRFAGSAPKHRVGYFPADVPTDFSPNLVQYVQDSRPR